MKIFMLPALAAMLTTCGPTLAPAEDWYDPRKTEEQRQAIHEWFATPVVRGCCKESDGFEADDFEVQGDHYVAIITDGEPNQWRPGLRTGTRIPVPNSQVKLAPPMPDGHGVIFLRRGWDENDPASIYVFCFFPPVSG